MITAVALALIAATLAGVHLGWSTYPTRKPHRDARGRFTRKT